MKGEGRAKPFWSFGQAWIGSCVRCCARERGIPAGGGEATRSDVKAIFLFCYYYLDPTTFV